MTDMTELKPRPWEPGETAVQYIARLEQSADRLWKALTAQQDVSMSDLVEKAARAIYDTLCLAAPHIKFTFDDLDEFMQENYRAQARAALAARQDGAWQPIETAPHEERVLLGWWQDKTWLTEAGMASHGWRRNGISTMSRHGQATHWQPLPVPPRRHEQ